MKVGDFSVFLDEPFGRNIEYTDPYPIATTTRIVERPQCDMIENKQVMTQYRDLDKDWLMEKCVEYIKRHNSLLDATQLCIDIFTILRKTDADVETLLSDLLGYLDFEFISLLISKRSEIVETVIAKSDIFVTSSKKSLNPSSTSNSQRTPLSYGTQVTVMTQEERDQLKNIKKQRKKEHKALSRKSAP